MVLKQSRRLYHAHHLTTYIRRQLSDENYDCQGHVKSMGDEGVTRYEVSCSRLEESLP